MLKKNLLFFLGLLFFQLTVAQNFTKEEKQLIEQNPKKMMRVMQMNHPTDSTIMRTVSEKINSKNKTTKLLAERMLLSVRDPLNPGVGIAAPQVGINRRMVLLKRFDKENQPFDVFINPEIIWQSELMQLGPEGDLSFEERGQVYRHYVVQVQYENLEGNTKTELLEGFTAVIFQHERDHLDGVLLTDRLDEQKVKTFMQSSQNANLYFEKTP